MIRFRAKPQFDAQALIIFLTESQWEKRQHPHPLPKFLLSALDAVVQSGQFSAKEKEIFPLVLQKQIVLLVGVGKKEKLTSIALRTITRQALLSDYLKNTKIMEIHPFAQDADSLSAIIEGLCIGAYSWTKYQSDAAPRLKLSEKQIYIVTPPKEHLLQTLQICEGVTLTRDLVNDNADFVTSEYLEKTIEELIKGERNISLKILNQKELKAAGLNLHLAVNQGSKHEPKLIIIKFEKGMKKDKFTALIGKGITFDSGGLNLKPSGHLENMRSDMAGAAALIGILKNVMALKIKKNLLFVLAIAENAIGSRAYKPGDIIRSYNGKTVEIGNTDAEGRLVLADAISYTAKNYTPKTIIDIATLTGACVVALGLDHTGLISNNDELAEKLLQAARKTNDRAWRLPSYPELKDSIKSQVADIRNTGYPKGTAGTLTAAEFLRQFTNDIPWAHLDIAGTAFIDDKQHLYFGYGATGAGVRLLTEYLKNN